MDICRQRLDAEYQEARRLDETDPIDTQPRPNNPVRLFSRVNELFGWRPGDPVSNSIPAELWLRWARGRLSDAERGDRGGNFRP